MDRVEAAATPSSATVVPRWAAGTAIVLGVFFVGLGLMRLLPVSTDQEMFASWGVPAWLRTGAAVAEFLAGSLLLRRRLRAVGAVGIFTIMVSAGTLHAALGHSMTLSALINGGPALLAAAVAWMHRRELATL